MPSIILDAKMTAGNSADGLNQESIGISSISSTGGITVGVGAKKLVAGMVWGRSGGPLPSAPVMTWNGVSMNLIAFITSGTGGAGNQAAAALFELDNPDPGALVLAGAWSGGTQDCYMSAISLKPDTGSAAIIVVGADTLSNIDVTSLTVTSDPNGATVVFFGVDGSTPTVNFTKIFAEAPNSPGGGANYALGGTSNTHTFTGAGGTLQALVGAHFALDIGAPPAVAVTFPSYRQPVPMRRGPGGLNRRSKVWKFSTVNPPPLPIPVPFPPDTPRAYQMFIPMRPTAGGLVIGRPIRFDTKVIIVGGTAYVRVANDTAQVSEVRSRLKAWAARVFGDSINASETTVKQFILIRFANNTLNGAEAVIRRVSSIRYGNNTMQGGEGRLRIGTWKRIAGESAQMSETRNRVGVWKRIVANTLNGTEALFRLLVKIRVVNDTLRGTDSTYRLLERLFIVVVNNTISAAENVRRKLSLVRFSGNTISAGETTRRPAQFIRRRDEAVQASESARRVGVWRRVVNSVLNGLSIAIPFIFGRAVIVKGPRKVQIPNSKTRVEIP